MTPYIDVEQAKSQIRGYEEIDDTELEEMVLAASAIVRNYLKETSAYEPELDSNDLPVLDSAGDVVYTTTVRVEVQMATKSLTAYMWRNRDENADGAFEQGYLPKPVTSILFPLRHPALA
jgi:hypothetical protein